MKQVRLPRHGGVDVSASLELIGESCLRTNLLTKRTLSEAQAGSLIEIVSDNLSAVETIPFMASNHDCEYLATTRDGAGCWRIYMRKLGGRNRATAETEQQSLPLRTRSGEQE